MEHTFSLLDFIDNMLGPYTLKYDTAHNVIGGLAGLDYRWLLGAALFCIGFVGVLAIGRTAIKALFG